MKRGPIILIVLLAIIAMFILGMNYGKHVEKTNEIFNTVSTATPAPSIVPTDKAPSAFSRYEHTPCGISFTKPDEFILSKESSIGATLSYNNQTISFECPKIQVNDLKDSEESTATTSVILGNKNIQAYTEGQNIRFIADHPYNKTPIIFSVDNNLLPLIESSLEFSN